MAENRSTPPVTMATPTSAELLQAQAQLWCHAFGYLKSMALQSAIRLGIPTAIHRRGGAASMAELHDALPVVPPSKRPCLSRLMKLLVAMGVFREDKAGTSVFSLTPVSRLLVEEEEEVIGGGQRTCLSPFAVMATSPFHFAASQRLPEWLEMNDDAAAAAAAETPFMAAHGEGLYGYLGRDSEFGEVFGGAMGADSRFVAGIVVRECGEAVFAGVTSLVDVGGGDGTTAKAIAKAFPHVRCSGRCWSFPKWWRAWWLMARLSFLWVI
ncbi:unnamed protein product [Urochloa decumbens]|uniref:Uncharacterized protein n=1 Tax=Urochloa decumbens TaxID=240449 RepID=A0ABC9EJU5_9POAL